MKERSQTVNGGLRFVVENIGGVARPLEIELVHGVNCLTGRNGAGKSSAIRGIRRALGEKVDVEVHDGAELGTVTGPGVVLNIRSVPRTSGVAQVELADVGPLADLIDPGFADAAARDRARIRAVLQLVDVPLSDDAIETLAGGDVEITEEAVRRIREGAIDDLLLAAEQVRLAGHELARTYERRVDTEEARGRAADERAVALEQELGAGYMETPVEDVEAIVAKADRDAALARVKAEQRQKVEESKAAIAAEQGERPNPETIGEEVRRRQNRVATVDLQITRLEADLAAARAERTSEANHVDALRRQQEREEGALRAWERRQEILALPVEGPTLEEAEIVREHAVVGRVLLARAMRSAEVRQQRATREEAATAAEAARLQAEILRSKATSVGERLGLLLTGTDAEGLTIVDGRLAAIVDGELRDFETRLSSGEQVRFALRLALRRFRGRVVPLDGDLYARLDPVRRQELAQVAAEMRVYLVTEQPAEGEEVVVEHETGEMVAAGGAR